MKWLGYALIPLVLLTSSSAWGDEDRRSVPLAKGQAAPYDGQLLTPLLAAELGVRANGCDERVAISVHRAKELGANALDLCRRGAEIDAERLDGQLALLRERLDEAGAWYRSPEFVAAVAVVLTTAVLFTARSLLVRVQP